MKKKKGICYSGIGGQAVLEGIMMKNKDNYAVAVRKPNNEIEVELDTYHSFIHGSKIKELPFIRGVFNFIDSMVLGIKCLNYSASFYEEEEQETKTDKVVSKIFKDNAEKIVMAVTTIISFALAIGIFFILPMLLSSLFHKFVRNEALEAVIEGLIRIVIFLVYVLLISLMKDIRRVYQYHGAEHKCINCIEAGKELTVSNVMRSSRLHRRCGTSFLLFVVIISIVLFFFIRTDSMLLKIGYRLLLIPLIASISYEIIRLAGKYDNNFTRVISLPGMLLQKLTTREPDRKMVEVAIVAIEAVFDWKKYIEETFNQPEASNEGEAEEETSEVEENAEEEEDDNDNVEENMEVDGVIDTDDMEMIDLDEEN